MKSSGFLAKYPGNKCLLCGLEIHAGHDHIVSLGPKGHYRHADDCTIVHYRSEIRRLASEGHDGRELTILLYADTTLAHEVRGELLNYAAEVTR